MLNMNNKPNMIARIPITIFSAENPPNIDAIPKNTKLIPIRIDTSPELKIGKIIKINPKIIDNIPDVLLASMFFPPNFVILTFQVKKFKKQHAFTFYFSFICYLNICYISVLHFLW